MSPNYADKEKYFPYATVILCTVMIGIFMLGLFFPEFSDILTNSTSKILEGYYWGFLTSSLVHSQWWHLLLNVPVILYLGYKVESRWGSILFIVIVLLSSIASDMFFMMVYMMNGYTVSLLGASGIKCGLLGFYIAMFLLELMSGNTDDVQNAFWGSVLVFAIAIAEIILSFFPDVAWIAHIGGACAGTLVAIVVFTLDYTKSRKTPMQ